MSPRFMVLNGLRLLLLVIGMLSSSEAIRALCLGGLVATLVVDVVLYRRDKRLEPSDDQDIHVPMPPDHGRREG